MEMSDHREGHDETSTLVDTLLHPSVLRSTEAEEPCVLRTWNVDLRATSSQTALLAIPVVVLASRKLARGPLPDVLLFESDLRCAQLQKPYASLRDVLLPVTT